MVDLGGRPKRAKGKNVRVPLVLTEDEVKAFASAMEKTFPGATTSYVLRHLISEFCKEAGIKWTWSLK